jgi:hypothetical protein
VTCCSHPQPRARRKKEKNTTVSALTCPSLLSSLPPESTVSGLHPGQTNPGPLSHKMTHKTTQSREPWPKIRGRKRPLPPSQPWPWQLLTMVLWWYTVALRYGCCPELSSSRSQERKRCTVVSAFTCPSFYPVTQINCLLTNQGVTV